MSMIKYLPAHLRGIRELSELCTVNDPDKDEIKTNMDNDADDFYIPSATIDGIERWEAVMHITSGEATIDERRFKLSSRVNNRAPFSEKRIREMLDNLLGNEHYEFIMTTATFQLEILLDVGTKHQINTVTDMLDNILPAHIKLVMNIEYNTHQVLGGFTHEHLSEYTHSQLQDTLLE